MTSLSQVFEHLWRILRVQRPRKSEEGGHQYTTGPSPRLPSPRDLMRAELTRDIFDTFAGLSSPALARFVPISAVLCPLSCAEPAVVRVIGNEMKACLKRMGSPRCTLDRIVLVLDQQSHVRCMCNCVSQCTVAGVNRPFNAFDNVVAVHYCT